LLAELVRASQRVGATAARKVKVRELSSLLRSLTPEEIDIGVHYLSGEIPQGKIGVGYTAVRAAASTAAADVETLSILDIDQRLTELAAIRGGGSAARRAQILKELFSRSTLAEQQFLLRLLIGELRQGALAGIMIDAVAAAAELPVAEVRRAAMYSKSLGAVARAAMREGPAALARFQLELFSPVSPMLAQTAAGLSCFFLPRWLPDGSVNAIRIQRLKDKLGNQANASAEVEFDNAHAWLVGEEGRGVPQILEMGTLTRLDCALGSSGSMRQALALALNHTAQRMAFGKPLIAQPLMRNVLADLALESEAATALSLRLARSCDQPGDAHESLLRRLLTPVAKFWVCKRGSQFAQEAMECLGGNGYVEEHGEGVMARIYREMPLNSIWEGAGNIMALDLLRALRHAGPAGSTAEALAAELAPARGARADFDRFADRLLLRVAGVVAESEARRVAQDLALAVQAALLRAYAPGFVWEAFCSSRLGGAGGQAFGMLGTNVDVDALVARSMPR